MIYIFIRTVRMKIEVLPLSRPAASGAHPRRIQIGSNLLQCK